MGASRSEMVDSELALNEEVKRIFADPEQWLDTPNDRLGGNRPRELIRAGQGQRVRDLLQAIKHGMFS
jgi:uncharacterized protein (DUF2384 family)